MQDVSHEILILHTQSKPKVNNPITQYSVMIMMKLWRIIIASYWLSDLLLYMIFEPLMLYSDKAMILNCNNIISFVLRVF